MVEEHVEDLLAFIDASPSPYHAVATMVERLEAAGYTRLDEADRWELAPGDRVFVVRDGGSIVALRVGAVPPSQGGFRLVGAHTDSPALKVRPQPDDQRSGYRMVGCEVYGGPLLHTWFDRDLTLAGRVALRTDEGVSLERVHLSGAPLRIPSLAIHLHREIRDEGFKPNPQQHVVPTWSQIDGTDRGLSDLLADALDADPDAIAGFDLVTADTQPAARGGGDGEWLLAPRIDNLASCHAGLVALLRAEASPATAVLVANDHEEVGSGTAEGARGSFLADVLERVAAATDAEPQASRRALARSLLISADTAHAVHPNYADKHEGRHRPRLGGGPVIKHNANQAYASDAGGTAWFASCATEAGAMVQHFVTRGDLPCGSTIGPLTATRLGLQTVDVGHPMLSMHSIREQAHSADLAAMIDTLAVHLARDAALPVHR